MSPERSGIRDSCPPWTRGQNVESDQSKGGAMENPVIPLQEIVKAPKGSDPEPRKLRASSYIIFVDLPEEREKMLLVHGYSGAYDLVSRKVATFIRSLEVGKTPRPLYGAWTPAPPLEA